MNTDTEVLPGGVTTLPPMPPAQRTASMQAADTLILPDGALQLLALAQRTADDHVAAVNRHVRETRAEAQALADRIRREAHSYADEKRAEADRTLAEARAEAERIVAAGREEAEQLAMRAQQRYEDTVGGLAVQRAALQRQIESLTSFDNEYRQRITEFLQNQLRALWAERPEPVGPLGTWAEAPGLPSAG